MNLKLKKVYMVSKKAEKPRLFLQHLVCEAAGLTPGQELYISINEENEEIQIQNYPMDTEHKIHVASRLSKVSGKRRPLVDTAGEKYSSIIDVKQKVEISVYRKGENSRIVIQPLRYSLFTNKTLPSQKDERIRLLSIAAGAGVGTAAMCDTQLFSAIQEVELEDDSAEVLMKNFPHSYIFNGDIRDVHEVHEADVVFASLPCNEFSSLGFQEGNLMNNLMIATAKIIKSSKAEMLFFENVPSFFKSETWFNLRDLLADDYLYWTEKELEAWEFGSIASRKRIYCCAFKQERAFKSFQFPVPKKMRRRKLKDIMDPANVKHEWKSLEKWMDSFNSREAWKDRSLDLTFVTKDATKIQCIPKRYAGHSASSSYVLNEENKKSWRFLSVNEIRKILGVPEWFEFTDHISDLRKYELLGQSVDCRVIKAIANRIAHTFMKLKSRAEISLGKNESQSLSVTNNGQLQLLFP
ncbi:DNA cytosine methyltransferase [Cytobacillus firmus]|uniref:DNA (cytosine-5-)-methyltransferase n=1 Tax=Cytobacillus firmus DS1 TaxID=1307436 RepID=W7KZJ8_CYTFI|nr:DNA cytosine methyltransferase [Cytobacillus firmus]EWG08716.1 site-specific DNA methylase [Cytobacillus firmus DS1]